MTRYSPPVNPGLLAQSWAADGIAVNPLHRWRNPGIPASKNFSQPTQHHWGWNTHAYWGLLYLQQEACTQIWTELRLSSFCWLNLFKIKTEIMGLCTMIKWSRFLYYLCVYFGLLHMHQGLRVLRFHLLGECRSYWATRAHNQVLCNGNKSVSWFSSPSCLPE